MLDALTTYCSQASPAPSGMRLEFGGFACGAKLVAFRWRVQFDGDERTSPNTHFAAVAASGTRLPLTSCGRRDGNCTDFGMPTAVIN